MTKATFLSPNLTIKTGHRGVSRFIGAERRFFAEAGVAFDPDTGMTYDGHARDESTGNLAQREWHLVPVHCGTNNNMHMYV